MARTRGEENKKCQGKGYQCSIFHLSIEEVSIMCHTGICNSGTLALQQETSLIQRRLLSFQPSGAAGLFVAGWPLILVGGKCPQSTLTETSKKPGENISEHTTGLNEKLTMTIGFSIMCLCFTTKQAHLSETITPGNHSYYDPWFGHGTLIRKYHNFSQNKS